MTRIEIRKLVWDKYNLEHIKKHNVVQDEVEEIAGNIITRERAKQGRYLVIGRVGSRMLTVIVNRKATGIYYPVTARDAAKRERRKVYEKGKSKAS